MKLTQKAKEFLLYYDSKTKSFDLFTIDLRKFQKKLQEFPSFDTRLFEYIHEKSFSANDLISRIMKLWLKPMTSLTKEILLTSNSLEIDCFFKNALLFLEIESSSIALMDLFVGDLEIEKLYMQSLKRVYFFFKNLIIIKELIYKDRSLDKENYYSSYITWMLSFSLEFYKNFEDSLKILPKAEAAIISDIITLMQSNIFGFMNIPIRTSDMSYVAKEISSEEMLYDSKFKDNLLTPSTNNSVMSLPFSYLSCLDKKNELLDYNLDFLNNSPGKPRKSENEIVIPSLSNTSKRQRTLSRISQKIREKTIHSKTFRGDEKIEKEIETKIVWLSEAEMRRIENSKKEKEIHISPPKFTNKYHNKNQVLDETEVKALMELNESNVLGCVNYDEVNYDVLVDLKKIPIVHQPTPERKANLLKFQEKLLKLQDDKEPNLSASMHDMESSVHKEISGPTNRGSILMNSIRRNSKKLPSKIVKDSYEQMKEVEKKNMTILKTFKKSKEKSKIKERRRKEDTVISIVKINGVSFQEPEELLGKNQTAELSPEFVKDVDEEDVLSNSSTSSDDEEKEWNSVIERKRFLNGLFQCSKQRLTLKRHSKILSGRERIESGKIRKMTEKKNLFQNWHLIEDIEVLRNVSSFNVKTSRESVNFFIIKFLINMKIKSHEFTNQLKIIRERWNKIKFAFQMYLLYRKLNTNRFISFFDEAHIIVQEMRQISLLHEFDKFLYLMERNESVMNRESHNNTLLTDFSRKRARSQSKNINSVTADEHPQFVMILERTMKKFNPKKHSNNCKKFMIFDAETIEKKLNEKTKPDIMLV